MDNWKVTSEGPDGPHRIEDSDGTVRVKAGNTQVVLAFLVEFLEARDRAEFEAHALRQLVRDWMNDSRAAMAVGDDCVANVQNDCPCLYCRGIKLAPKW